jgi:hypothetical protein
MAASIDVIISRMQDWLKAQGIYMLYVKTRSPWATDISRASTTSCPMNACVDKKLSQGFLCSVFQIWL